MIKPWSLLKSEHGEMNKIVISACKYWIIYEIFCWYIQLLIGSTTTSILSINYAFIKKML